MDDFDASIGLWKVLGDLFSPIAPAVSAVDKMQKNAEASRDPYVKEARAARESAENTSFITPEYLADLGSGVQANWDTAAKAQSEHEDYVEKSREKAKRSREEANSNLDYYMNMQDPLSLLPLDASNYLGAFGSSPDFPLEPVMTQPKESDQTGSTNRPESDIYSRDHQGTPATTEARRKSLSDTLQNIIKVPIISSALSNSSATPVAALAGGLSSLFDFPFSSGNKDEESPKAEDSSGSYIPHKATSFFDEAYETLAAHPELAEKYSEFADKDNYGWTRARASHNSDFFADLALADPRIMSRFANSGVDVEDLEHLSENIYNYMWDPEHVINLYSYATDGPGYLGDSRQDVEDAMGYLMQMSNYDFNPDFRNRWQTDFKDALFQAIIRNAYAGGGKEYDLDDITQLAREAGYLTDDESFGWGKSNDAWWVDNNEKRASLPNYVGLGTTEYLNPSSGRFDDNAALSFADAMSIAEEQIKDKNGNPSNRRVVVKNSKAPTGNSATDRAEANSALAAAGY